jgi:CRISPR-associated protein Cas2
VVADGAGIEGRFRSMWVLVMFDVPVKTGAQKKAYRTLVKALRRTGFLRLQYSVYARHCRSQAAAAPLTHQIRSALPAGGEVRLLLVTEHQYEKTIIYRSRKRSSPEQPLDQFLLF